jgi:RNA polymerase sigma-70 factor (ECF subfamily)
MSNQAAGADKVAVFIHVAQHNRRQLLWVAKRMTRDQTEAEDIVQEALLKAFKNLPRFRGESKMVTWLGEIVKNTGREWLRGRRGRVMLSLENVRNSDNDPVLRDFPDPRRGPEQSCVQKELRDILLTEIDGLKAACKTTMKMCALDEISQFEAAIALGVSVASIKSRMFRGKRMLKRAVCRRIGGGDDFVESLGA